MGEHRFYKPRVIRSIRIPPIEKKGCTDMVRPFCVSIPTDSAVVFDHLDDEEGERDTANGHGSPEREHDVIFEEH